MENSKKITIPKLGDDNFYSWSYEMEMLLSSKGLWNHCLTEEQQINEIYDLAKETLKSENPEADLKRENVIMVAKKLLPKKDADWYSNDKKCLAIIGLNVDPKFIPTIRAHKTAAEVWNGLKANFTSQSGGTILSLKTKFYKAELEEGKESLTQYLDRIVLLTEKLKDLGCATQEDEICYKVLSSLPESYNSMTMALMVIPNDKLKISYLRSQFTLDSALHSASASSKGNVFQAQQKKKETNSRQKCSKCGMKNHKDEDCYAPRWKIEKHQEALKKPKEEAKEAIVMLTGSQQTNKASLFYLDSGCTRHMVSTTTHVTNRNRTEYQVYGAFGHPTKVSDIGPIILKQALIVHGLSKNLISIKNMCEKGYQVYFKDKECKVFNPENELILEATVEPKSVGTNDDIYL
jgi:hypothetical protein